MSKIAAYKTDINKYYHICVGRKKIVLQVLRLWLLNYGFQCVLVFRLVQATETLLRKCWIAGIIPYIIAKVVSQFYAFFRHVEISSDAKIGKGFFLMHSSDIYIGPVTIGENCVIHHNVTIGEKVAFGSRQVPSIGNNVWIGPGAIITGDIRIGDGATIAAGCVISKDVPDACLAAGNPGRVILNNYDNSSMINYQMFTDQ